jgi:hypothetical protein
MVEHVNVSEIRKKAMNAYMSDGIWEIFLGSMLTIIGALKLSEHYAGGMEFNPAYVSVVIVLSVIIIPRIKAKLTFPRIGYVDVKHARHRSVRNRLLLLALIAIGLIGLVFLLSAGEAPPREPGEVTLPYVGLYFAGFVAVVISTVAFIRQVRRMHFASVFFIVVFGALHLLKIYPGFGFLITGVGLLVAGLFILVGFIRNNPVLPIDELASEQIGGGNG